MSEKEIRKTIIELAKDTDNREIQSLIRRKFHIDLSLQQIHDIKLSKEAVAWFKRKFPAIIDYLQRRKGITILHLGKDDLFTEKASSQLRKQVMKFREMFGKE